MDRNTLLAILLSFILVLVFLTFFSPPKEKKERKITETQEESKKPITDSNDKNNDKDEITISNKTKEKIKKAEELDLKNTVKDTKAETEKEKVAMQINFNVTPSPAFDPNNDSSKNKIKTFEIESSVLKLAFSSIDASLTSAKLKKYRDEKGQLIDAVFDKSADKTVLPLATSFVSARNLNYKRKAVYEYAIYDYTGKEKKLSCSNTGTLSDRHEDYFEIVKKNISKAIRTYDGNYEVNYKAIVFSANYSIKTENKTQEIEFIKVYVIDEKSYLFNIDISIKNLSSEALVLLSNDKDNENASFYIHWGNSLGPFYSAGKQSQYDENIQSAYLAEQEDFSTEEFLVDTNSTGFSNFKWLSLDSRYLMVSLIPQWNNVTLSDGEEKKRWNKSNYFGEVYAGETRETSSFIFWTAQEKIHKNRELIGIGFYKMYFAKANESKDFHISVYLGPKTRSLISKERYEDFELIKVRDRSWVPFIKPLEWAMEWLLFASYDYIYPNFGIAIIILTIILKILLHPLTRKSLDATRKMSELQPKIKELEAKFKNSKEKQQKALMQLYKKEGINPLGGCLPIVFQLPVFFALWNVLPYLLELKSSHFLWIKDLSSPDTVAHLPLILTNDLNILPIIMTITSVIQMKLTPQATPGMGMGMGGGDSKAQTAKIMQYTMPAVFILIFWSMPSGLVLYWTVQNMLQIGQQLYTNLRGKKKKKK